MSEHPRSRQGTMTTLQHEHDKFNERENTETPSNVEQALKENRARSTASRDMPVTHSISSRDTTLDERVLNVDVSPSKLMLLTVDSGTQTMTLVHSLLRANQTLSPVCASTVRDTASISHHIKRAPPTTVIRTRITQHRDQHWDRSQHDSPDNNYIDNTT